MKNIFTPIFLKFLSRFVFIVLFGVIGALIVGHLDFEQKQARTFQPDTAVE